MNVLDGEITALGGGGGGGGGVDDNDEDDENDDVDGEVALDGDNIELDPKVDDLRFFSSGLSKVPVSKEYSSSS